MHASYLLTLLPVLGAAIAQPTVAPAFIGKGQVRAVGDLDGKDIGCLTNNGGFSNLPDDCGMFTGKGSAKTTKLTTKQGGCGTANGPGNSTIFACNAIFMNGGQDFGIGELSAGSTLEYQNTTKATWTNEPSHVIPTGSNSFQPQLVDRNGQQGTFFNLTWKPMEI